jgi:hypothetical protein
MPFEQPFDHLDEASSALIPKNIPVNPCRFHPTQYR